VSSVSRPAIVPGGQAGLEEGFAVSMFLLVAQVMLLLVAPPNKGIVGVTLPLWDS